MKNLSLIGETGNRDDVIIKGLGMNGTVTHIFNVAASNVTIANMTIGWVKYHPIQIHGESNADNALVHNVKIIDGNEQFIKISGGASETHSADSGIISCCHFEFSAGIGNQYYTGGIDGHHCTDWIIQYNTFKHIRSPESNLAEHAIHFWSNSKDIVVENNLIVNCDRGIGFGLGNDPARGNFGGVIRNNFVHTSRDVGIGIEYSPDVKIYNNTIWTDNYFNSIEYRFPFTTNTHIANNLSNKNISRRDNAMATLENNFTRAETSMFVDALKNDYHLAKYDSRLIGQGTSLQEVIIDYDCELRNSSFDIGADQYSSNTSTNHKNSDSNNIEILYFPEYLLIHLHTDIQFEAHIYTINGQLVEIFNKANSTLIIPKRVFSSKGLYLLKIHNSFSLQKFTKILID
jgi:hypothetical protein